MNIKDLLRVSDLSRSDIEEIFELTDTLKKKRERGEVYAPLAGKTLGLIFSKASTRTRISFEAGMLQLGGHSIYLDQHNLQMSRGESIKDSARIFSAYLDGVVIRTFSHVEVEELAMTAMIPIINGLTDTHHPCQILADLYTIKSRLGRLEGVKIAYIGDGNNVVNSLMEGAAIFGMELTISTPKGYEPDADILKMSEEVAAEAGGKISLCRDPMEAARKADILYTDVWISMGQEKERAKREKDFKGYQINNKILKQASKDALVMHCLPAHRGEEITAEVIDGDRSIVFEEAENRLHVQKAVLQLLLS
ncbi:MAG: ornithine carbamoyltransferase [Nitrospinota bacterium]|nr:ornithine carbamoyltransferase [Nitrospinota bacterium]